MRERRTMTKTCPQCGCEFARPYKERGAKFCGHRCAILANQDPIQAGITEAVRETIANKLRGRGKGKTYPRMNGRPAHRVVAERKLGRPLRHGEIVHHKDENILNYDESNLEVLPGQAEHATRHHITGRKRTPREVCEHGHPLAGGNVRVIANGARRCVTCMHAYDADWHRAKRRARGLITRRGAVPGSPGAQRIAESNRRRTFKGRTI